MPIVNGDYQQLTAEEIREALESELINEFGADIDLTESSVFTTLAGALAAVTSRNTEESLEEVYESAFLETAEGDDLDKVVSIVGLQRRAAIHATGVQRFISDDPVTNDFNIQSGVTVQTDSDDPTQFETTETATLDYVTGFESQNTDNLSGDTGAVSFNTADPYAGDVALQLDSSSANHVFRDDVTISEGSEYHCRTSLQTGADGLVTFGVQDNSNYYRILLQESNDRVRLQKYEGDSVTELIGEDTGVTIPTDTYLDVELDWRTDGQIFVSIYDDNEDALSDDDRTTVATISGADSAPDSRWKGGRVGYGEGTPTAAVRFDESALSSVSANIRAVSGGSEGNVGASTITSLPSPPSGVDRTLNVFPTGSTQYTDTNGDTYVVGQDEETDEQLRERATEAVSAGGAATHDALVNAILNDIPDVSSVTVFENKTDDDNTGTGGLPPHSFEAVVYGGDDLDVAETIFETKAVTARDYGGANGTAISQQVTANSNGQQFTINFSRPTKLDIDMTMDLVVDDTYIGEDDLRNLIVEYVGGVLADGTSAVGLGVGEDVRVDTIEDIVVGDETGVIGFNKTASTEDITTTPSKTTNSDGLEIISVGSNEVPQTDATDGSITINTTQI